MYIPPILGALFAWSLPEPLRSHPPSSSPTALDPAGPIRSFRPVHAHATTHDEHKTLFHNATRAQSLWTTAHDDFVSTAQDAQDPPGWLALRTRRITIRRPRAAIRTRARLAYTTAPVGFVGDGARLDWEDTEVEAPDVTDRETLRSLAKMASNAYVTPEGGEWWPLDGYNTVRLRVARQWFMHQADDARGQTVPFGWEKDSDGLRGHVVGSAVWGWCVTESTWLNRPRPAPVRRRDQLDRHHLHQGHVGWSVRVRRAHEQE